MPNGRWATDRRTTRRHFLFTPDEAGCVEQAFWYFLAVNANKHGIEIYVAVLMATHPHLVYGDPRGVQPDFKRDFHRDFAHWVKAFRGWPEEVFNKSQGGELEPLTPDAIIESMGYAIANPVNAFAVRYAKDWPGAKTLPEDIGTRVIRVPRPNLYIDQKNPQWPKVAELRLHMPPILEETYGADEARRRIAAVVRRLEQEALEEVRRRRVAFRGARRVKRTPHTVRARSYEVFGSRNPRFKAAGDLEAARAQIARNRRFDAAYDIALRRWINGDRTAVFPYGTWWMRVHHGADVEPPPPD